MFGKYDWKPLYLLLPRKIVKQKHITSLEGLQKLVLLSSTWIPFAVVVSGVVSLLNTSPSTWYSAIDFEMSFPCLYP